MRRLLPGIWLALAIPGTLPAQGSSWRHSGSLFLSTKPDGADLPAAASERDVPVLVRLNDDFFDFREAKSKGDDLRFFSSGKALAYQIEEWEPAKGAASIWVRVPAIVGNARQEIELRWGNPDAASESSGAAVFNESSGFVSVFHFGGGIL